ncbi:hypothetical protein L596_026368 [Steinernema carpocapsae]|uniref:7TM GPCR serpentine receptor class x (Srx) domain-containing protein n=1 Tax=Steinernema carpocapsae TaxID=34508 RepID=A0A4U5M149_STECR|nr:hypothetical protein L596_026368 [Steinernema carpocapsae]
MYTPLSITISCAIGILAFLSISLNFTVIGVIKHGGFASKQRGNPIYIIALANMLGDVFQLCLILGYIVPSTFVQDFIYNKETVVKFLSFLFISQWYQSCFLSILTSVSRFVIFLKPQFASLFSRNRLLVKVILIYPLGWALGAAGVYLTPCCTLYMFYGTYGYAYLDENDFNYTGNLIDFPLNLTMSTCSIIAYSAIFVHLHRSTKVVQSGQQKPTGSKKKEIAYAVQCAILSSFSLLTWSTFRVFPMVVPHELLPAFSTITFLHIFHCSANAIVYFFINKEIGGYARTFVRSGVHMDTLRLSTARSSQAHQQSSARF